LAQVERASPHILEKCCGSVSAWFFGTLSMKQWTPRWKEANCGFSRVCGWGARDLIYLFKLLYNE